MRLGLDQLYSPQIAEDLRAEGFDVISVAERPELEGMSDPELLAAMTIERRALLTENVRDFAPLIDQIGAAGDSHFGMVYSSHSRMPRSNATIGVFVRALSALMRRYPGDEDLRDRVEWLQPD